MNALLRSVVMAAVSLAVVGTASEAEPLTVPPEVVQTTRRFFDAIRENNATDYRAIADGVEISYSDADDKKLSLDQAHGQFPDCGLIGATGLEDLGNSAYTFNGIVNCRAGDNRTQTVGIIADRGRIYMVRPGGFASDQKSPAENAKAETDAQSGLDWLASNPLQVPAGAFKSWSKKDQQTFPAMMRNSCAYIWTMAHDASDRLLPAAISREDEWTLGVDVCLLGHMPADWPQRQATLQHAQTILRNARGAGSSLKMPPNIAP